VDRIRIPGGWQEVRVPDEQFQAQSRHDSEDIQEEMEDRAYVQEAEAELPAQMLLRRQRECDRDIFLEKPICCHPTTATNRNNSATNPHLTKPS